MDTGTSSFPSRDEMLRKAAEPRCAAFQEAGALTPEAQSYLNQFLDDADAEEIAGLTPQDLLCLAHAFWAWARKEALTRQQARLQPAVGIEGARLPRDILEIAGPDMHFLVDSVMNELSAQGHIVRALIHPVVAGEAGAKQSLIQIHLDRLSPAQSEAVLEGVRVVLADVRAANADFKAMKASMRDCANELAAATTPATPEMQEEAIAFLRWLEADNFTFLGARQYQYPRDAQGAFVQDEPTIVKGSGLGVLRDPDAFVLRRGAEPSVITPEIQRFLQESAPLVVAKSNVKGRVHRRVHADYVGVKRYDAAGSVVGETRFVGLFTADAYNRLARDVPLISGKVGRVLARAGMDPKSHNGKALQNIVENYPRDELFQISEDELLRTSLAILHLFDRPRPKAFIRRDRFDRYVSVIAFVPKDRFNAHVREAIGQALADHYRGRVSAAYPVYGDAPLARIHYIIGHIDRAVADPDPAALDASLAELTRTWKDNFAAHARDQDAPLSLLDEFSDAFSAGYQERFEAAEALTDALEITRMRADEPVRVRAYNVRGGPPDSFGCKIYANGCPLALSAFLPVLENMGLFAKDEVTLAARTATLGVTYIHDIQVRTKDGADVEVAAVEQSFEDAFAAIWAGRADNDGLNTLILKLGIPWREAALIRALAAYRRQTGLDPSAIAQEQALLAHPEISRALLKLFAVRFDPGLGLSQEERRLEAGTIESGLEHLLADVASLDADRALRRIAQLITAVVRTNYYQPGPGGAPKSYMSFKIDSAALEALPAPKPYREIWVASPDVEGVHLRFGPIARGGIRWSDRRDDFRAEVLELVKAQQVKNAIIVPVGAKGGFFPKRLPDRRDPAWAGVGQDAYKIFLRGLLDLTDNIRDGELHAPQDVVRWDGDDPYLVVAADKGTATFSDIANAISAEYGHWLGDAFASGGSVGYDHKKMGITARGAWEAVKRHFRELGKDIQTTPFTVIGVGDMSGDVFGNGMLLSEQIQLIAAFDHRDIFIDPQPDLAKAFAERKRLFALTRSSWKDYDKSLISAGGGVFSRELKSIPLSPQMREISGLDGAAATPSELISALLTAPCELLWFGGIGAFVKAVTEQNLTVGDKANDAHRVDAKDVRALVIGEGANLGVTQAGRIEFARKGGRINTDAIDNSAGVDTSDHEVNIKILLAEALQAGALTQDAREPLLESMTEEVAELVLADNYDQTFALSLAEASAVEELDFAERFMQRLEKDGRLSRKVEGLPSSEAVRELQEKGLGLTRPELAKIMAYAKIDAFDALVASEAPDDPHFFTTLRAYFPPQLAGYAEAMRRHRLRREIIATSLADDVVNLGGLNFIDRVRETARADTPDIARAFQVARHVYRLDDLARRIHALDNAAPAEVQLELFKEMERALARHAIYLTRHGGLQAGIDPTIARYAPAIAEQARQIWEVMTDQERVRATARATHFIARGARDDLARDVAVLPTMVAALDVADLADRTGWPATSVARVFRWMGAAFGLDRLRGAANAFELPQHWERLALRRTLEELYEDQRLLSAAALRRAQGAPRLLDRDQAAALGQDWIDSEGSSAMRALETIAELEMSGGWSFAKTILAAAEVRSLAGMASAA